MSDKKVELNRNIPTQAQMTAATAAGVIAGDIGSYLRAPTTQSMVATENMAFIDARGGDTAARLKESLEAYDEKENKNAITYSVAYNLQAARQDEFGETFFPTVVVTPDQIGFNVSIRLVMVYDEVRRQTTGAVDNFGKRNIIQAVIDPTILKNDMTKIVPVYTDTSASKFVPAALLAPRNVMLDELQGEEVTTSALAMGQKLSLLGISQTEALMETGLQDSTDSIDPAIQLASLYMTVVGGTAAAPVTEVLKFETLRLPQATFNYAQQDNYRVMNLQFSTDSLMVNSTKTLVDGSTSVLLAPIAAAGVTVRLSINVSGTVNTEIATTELFTGALSVASVTGSDGTQLPLTSGVGAQIAALFNNSVVVGYDLDARRTNMNRRMRGQLLDTTFYNQIYAVPLLSPITVPRPLTIGDANDSSDLAALITATHIRTSNAAVAELLRVQSFLADYVNAADNLAEVPQILGVARFLVQPFYEHQTIDVSQQINSITSFERAADIQALLVNILRDLAYNMYTQSGYKAAADALAGGISQVPTVIIGTDPIISRYLTVTGDFRTLGNDFNVKVVSTLNQNMRGKIIMSFGDMNTAAEGVPNPMHFGNMAWKPELTLVLPLHRNGANSKELTVQPSFLHITNLPVMAALDVTGITEAAVSKLAIAFQSVTGNAVVPTTPPATIL